MRNIQIKGVTTSQRANPDKAKAIREEIAKTEKRTTVRSASVGRYSDPKPSK